MHKRMELKKRQPWHLFLLVSLVKIPSAWQMASILFIGPDKPSGTYHCSAHLLQVRLSDPCSTYIRGNITFPNNRSSSVAEELVLCENFEFSDDHYSIINQWELVCRRKILVSVSQFFYLTGVFLGGVTYPFLLWILPPDLILVGGVTVQILVGASVAFSPYFTLHCLLRLLTAIGCTYMFTSGYIICTALLEDKAKVVAACCYEHLWSVGVITLPFIAHFFSDWRHFQLAISLPSILILLCVRFIPKCAAWEPRKKKKQIVVTEENNLPRSEIKTVDQRITLPERSEKEHKVSINTLHNSWRQKVRYAALHGVWACTVVSYYGGLLNGKNWGPSLLINTIAAGLAEIAGTLLGLALLLRSSSVWLSVGGINITGGLASVLTWTLPHELEEDLHYVLLALAMFGRIAIATCLTTATVASPKVFPECHRNSGMFTCVALGRGILLVAPFIGNLAVFGKPVPLTVFGSLSLLAGLCSLTLAVCGQYNNKVSPESVAMGSRPPTDAEERDRRKKAAKEETNDVDSITTIA